MTGHEESTVRNNTHVYENIMKMESSARNNTHVLEAHRDDFPMKT